MATTIRPELSEKNPYWIEKHRYYELKHLVYSIRFGERLMHLWTDLTANLRIGLCS